MQNEKTKGFEYHYNTGGDIKFIEVEPEDIEFEATEKKYLTDSLGYAPEKYLKKKSVYLKKGFNGLIGNCVGTSYAILAVDRAIIYEQYKSTEKTNKAIKDIFGKLDVFLFAKELYSMDEMEQQYRMLKASLFKEAGEN